MAENGSKHALVINIGSVTALVSVFRQPCESLYLCNLLGDIKYMEVLMFALRSLRPLLRFGMVLCSDECSEAIDRSQYHRHIESELIKLSTRI